tara:strand:+ start:375 stop:782 length:408 start_codon:yes stop_codon:yes gene_type:complete
MKLINWTPNNALFDIFDNIDSYVEPYFQNRFKKPNVSINDMGNNYSVLLEMPGIDKKDIDITVNEGILNIKAEKKESDDKVIYSEINNYNYSRSFYIPDDVKIDKIKAKSLNGLLNIELPKLKSVNKNLKRIAIS